MGMRTGLHWNRTCSCPITRHVDFASCVHVMPHSTAQIRVKRVTCHLPCPRQLNKTEGEDSVTFAASPLFPCTRLTDPVCLCVCLPIGHTRPVMPMDVQGRKGKYRNACHSATKESERGCTVSAMVTHDPSSSSDSTHLTCYRVVYSVEWSRVQHTVLICEKLS